jgi:hypothetical protein
MLLVVILGLAAAFLLALSASIQQYAARSVSRSAARPPTPPRGLVKAFPLGARRSRRRPRPSNHPTTLVRTEDWLSAAAIVLFLVVRGTAPLSGRTDRQRVILAGLCTLAVAGLIVTVAANQRPGCTRRCSPSRAACAPR